MAERPAPTDAPLPEETLLPEILASLLSTTDPGEVLDLVARHAARLIQAGKTSINLAEGDRLRTVAKFIEPGGYFDFLSIKKTGANPLPLADHPHLYEVLRTGQPRTIESRTIHDLKERVLGRPVTERPEVFYILEPLRLKGEVIGVACLNLTRPELEAITARQRALVHQLLDLAAIALNNARLIGRLRSARGELQETNTRLQDSLEELQVAEEELRQHNDELIAAREALEEERRRYLELFEFAPDAYLLTDPAGMIREANRAAGALLGLDAAQLLGKPLALFVAEEDRPGFRVRLAGCQGLGGREDWELSLARREGAPMAAAVSLAPVRDPQGRVSGLRWLIRDVTDRKRAAEAAARLNEGLQNSLEELQVAQEELLQQNEELITATEALRRSEERFRTLAAAAPAGILYTDARGYLTYANQHYCRIAGRNEEALKGWGWAEAIHPEDRERISREWAEAAAGGRPYTTQEYRFLHPGGDVVWAWANTTPLHDANGELLGHVAVVADVTDRKRAEEALRRSEERYALAQRAAGIGSWDWDILTGALGWSDAIEPMFGFAPGGFERTYEAFLARVHEDDRQFVIDSVNACVEKGADYDIEHRIVWPDDTVHWVSETGDVIRDESGRAIRMLGVVQDITARKQAEEALRRAHDELEARVQERTADLAGAKKVAEAERQRLYGVLETLPVYAVLLTRDYYVPFANRFFRDRFGESHGRRCFEYLFGRTEPCEICETYKVLKTNARHHWEWTGPDGRDYDIFDYPFTDSDGSPLIMEVGVDITERKRAERVLKEVNEALERRVAERTAELSEAKEYQGAVLGGLEEAVLSVDREGRIVYSNQAASRHLGYAAAEMRRLKVCDLHARCAEEECPLKHLDQTSAPVLEDEVEFKTRGGQVIFGRQRFSPLRDRQGQVIGAVVVVQDVSTVRRLEDQAAYLAEEVQELSGRHGMVIASRGMQQVMRQVAQVAPTDSSVLIQGETGTGKELIARLVHDSSPRAAKPMVKVHCAALSPGLIESEFFGHEKGAFTGALSRKLGRFELADGGTIFLDEVGDIPLETQVKLLRVIQEREFERVGGTRPIKVDVRIVAATNRDLEEAVEAGTFRRDLFYRLSVFPIHLPPLRERGEAIPVLAAHFAQSHARTMGKTIEGISPLGLERLAAYGWPGNVRELRNVIERAVITSTGPLLAVPELGGAAPASRATPAPSGSGLPDLEENERAHILRALERTGWRVEGAGGAAELLRINASTLRSRMKRLGIARPRRGRDISRAAVSGSGGGGDPEPTG